MMQNLYRLSACLFLFLCSATTLLAGATGEEDLGSEEIPVVWGMVFEDGVPEPVDDMKRFLVPIELEIGYYTDVTIFASYRELFAALQETRVHCVLLPPLTFLVARRDGLVEPGIVSSADSTEERIRIGTYIIAGDDFDPEAFGSAESSPADSSRPVSPLRIARFDPLSQDGWIVSRLALEATGLADTDGMEIIETDSYDAVIASVESGEANIGVLPGMFAARLGLDGTAVVELESIGGWGLHFSPVVPGQMRGKIISSLEERAADPQSLGFLHSRFGWSSVVPVDEDYILSVEALLASTGVDISVLP